jgi:subtilisin family serine protease
MLLLRLLMAGWISVIRIWDNVWVNEDEKIDDGIDNDGNGYIDDIFGWNFVNDTSWVGPMDAHMQQDDAWSHGTIVASLVAARGNNAEGIAGVTWNSRFMPLVVLDGDGLEIFRASLRQYAMP